MKEIWKDIEGYKNYYQVSNTGKIKSLSKKVKAKAGFFRFTKERILKPGITDEGYNIVVLSVKNKRKTIQLHRIVATAFINNEENKPNVNHKDGIKTNNIVSNLEWSTQQENVNHSIKVLNNSYTGEANPTSKLKNKDVLVIKNSNLTGVELAKIYNVSGQTISYIKNNKRWKHI
jgi:hypothetical protein